MSIQNGHNSWLIKLRSYPSRLTKLQNRAQTLPLVVTHASRNVRAARSVADSVLVQSLVLLRSKTYV